MLHPTRASRKERIKRLRNQMIYTVPRVCPERARLVTESYRETESLPTMTRRALALDKVLSEMTILILEDELIVGNQGSMPRSAPVFPEYCISWLEKELKGETTKSREHVPDKYWFIIDDDTRDQLLEIIPYWKGKTNEERVLSAVPDDVKLAGEIGALHWGGHIAAGDGHLIVNYEKVLKKGLSGIIAEAKQVIADLDYTDPESVNKRTFLEGTIITMEAAIKFAHRFADKAQELGNSEANPVRKAELEKIANNCRYVPEHPARDFWEALQSLWFVQVVLQIESNGHSISLGRFDQYLYPYYKQDVEAGILTRDKALELVQCFWVKLFSIMKLRSRDHSRYTAGYPVFQNITIGGQILADGDVTNEMTYICLDAMQETRLPQPSLSARIHPGSPEKYLMKCAEVIRSGLGQPALFNDEVIIPSLVSIGISLEDAYNYAPVGCIEVGVPAKWAYCPSGRCHFNLAKILELAINNGKDPKTGYQLCPGDGDLSTFKNFDDVLKAYEKQMKFYVAKHIAFDNINDWIKEDWVPDLFCSALLDNCIKRGKTIKQGGAVYDFTAGQQCGTANVGSGLAVIKKFIFDEGRVSGEKLLEVLHDNFTGPEGEQIRQMIIEEGPHFGNDDPEADTLAAFGIKCFVDEVTKYKNTRHGRGPIGGRWQASTSTVSANVPLGFQVGATPDGRKSGEPLAEGCSPAQGRDRLGPTAVMKSVAKLPNILISGGQLLNQKITPDALDTEAGLHKLMDLVQAFFEMKGWHVQFNVVSAETLKDARDNPEKYPDLIVRVAGYSALFTSLDPAVQQDIINRTEQTI